MLRRFAKRLVHKNNAPPIVASVLADSLTYLGQDALFDLYREVSRLECQQIEGMLIEAGCALGGSAIVIAAAKSKARLFQVYDVFGMIPPPSDQDGDDVHERYEIIRSGKSRGIGGNTYYGYEENLLKKVEENFRRYGFPVEKNNIQLIKGLFQNTLHVEQKVALAHIDGDWYESVLTCLNRIAPHLTPGGVLVIDDYNVWSGCRKAVDEYFSDKGNMYRFVQKSRLHIVRQLSSGTA